MTKISWFGQCTTIGFYHLRICNSFKLHILKHYLIVSPRKIMSPRECSCYIRIKISVLSHCYQLLGIRLKRHSPCQSCPFHQGPFIMVSQHWHVSDFETDYSLWNKIAVCTSEYFVFAHYKLGGSSPLIGTLKKYHSHCQTLLGQEDKVAPY